jgi:hypothetical protein
MKVAETRTLRAVKTANMAVLEIFIGASDLKGPIWAFSLKVGTFQPLS